MRPVEMEYSSGRGVGRRHATPWESGKTWRKLGRESGKGPRGQV